MTALRQKLLGVFAVEYREHLEAMRQILAKVGDALNVADLTEATRRAHSLKGAARAVGLPAVETLAHRLESLFIDAGKDGRAFDTDVRRFVLDMLDEIEDKAADAGSEQPARARRSGDKPATSEKPVPAGTTTEPATPAAAPVGAPEPSSIRIDAQNLDRLLRSAGELHADMILHNATAVEIDKLSRQVNLLQRQWAKIWREVETAARRREPPRRAVMRAANGEALTVQMREVAKGLRAAAHRQSRGARALTRHLAELEHHVKSARMLPAESVFGGFRKMVRDIAATEGREVEVEIEGLECQADRLVLQRIKDPVMHMLTNAVSHGIEAPEDRAARGKKTAGRVALRLNEAGGRLNVVVEDDGRGIDFRKIAARAVADGRMRADEAAAAPTDALLPLLFEPGFSTADAVTTISGRGVGLSVVRETVTALQGTIDVQSALGQGTKFRLSLPVNVLSRRLLLMKFRDALYALPTDAVVRVMRVAAKDLATVAGRPAVRLADTSLPLVSIGEIVASDDPAATTGIRGANVVIVRTGGAHVGSSSAIAVAVDELVGVSEFIVRPLDITSARRLWSGIVATDDGTPCLVLNPAAFAGAFLSGTPAVLREPASRREEAKVVLVVDDSITTRTLEKSILEAHGYRVRLSVDGRDALAQVRANPPDLVISDVEMPHLDGFGLVGAMKEDRTIAHVPVILVTSRADEADRERGLRLGADAYVVKQRFDQAALLETIRQIV